MASPDRSPRQIRLLTALLLFGMFVAGVATGAGLARWGAPRHPPPGPPDGLPPPMGEIDLSAEQRREAMAVGEKYRPELDAILRSTFPQVRAVHERMKAELRALLTPAQQERFDALEAHAPPVPMGPPGGPGLAPPPPGAAGMPPPPMMMPPPPAPPVQQQPPQEPPH